MGGASLNWKFCWVSPPGYLLQRSMTAFLIPLWAKILDFLWTPKVRLKSAISTHKRGEEHLRSFHVGVFRGVQIVAVDNTTMHFSKI